METDGDAIPRTHARPRGKRRSRAQGYVEEFKL